jgi:hypothetical protein
MRLMFVGARNKACWMAALAFRAARQVLQTPVVATMDSKGRWLMISQRSSLVFSTACAAL